MASCITISSRSAAAFAALWMQDIGGKDTAMPASYAGPSRREPSPGPWPGGPPAAHQNMTMLNGGHSPLIYTIPYALWQWEHMGIGLPDLVPQIVAGLADAANAAQVAAVLPEGQLRSELEARAAAFVEAALDDYCGTRPPWPGLSPWATAIASALSELANTYQAGFLRDELLRIAGQAMQKAAGNHRP
jgi:hypothetical protein